MTGMSDHDDRNAQLHAEGRVTQAIGIALTTPIYEFATHRAVSDADRGLTCVRCQCRAVRSSRRRPIERYSGPPSLKETWRGIRFGSCCITAKVDSFGRLGSMTGNSLPT